MNQTIKLIYVALVLVFVLSFSLSFVHVPAVYAAESPAQDKTLSFLADVIMLDITKYNVTLLHDKESYPAEYGGIIQEEVRYKLETNGSDLDVTFVYRDSTLAFGTIYVHPAKSSLHYTQPQSANLIDTTKGLLERYQDWAGSSRYQEMRDILDLVNVNEVESTTVTLDNVNLGIEVNARITSFNWVYKYNDLEKPGLYISFRDGIVETISDIYGIVNVGSTTINVSEEEAILIAMDRAKSFSWKVGLDPNATKITDFTILEKPVKTELSLQAREPLTLYPFWRIDLYLDKTYPGGVSSIVVGIWADTNEIRYILALAYGGGSPPASITNEPESPTTEPPLNNFSSSFPSEYVYTITAVTAAAIATTIGYLYLKRKK